MPISPPILLSGSSNLALAQEVATLLGLSLSKIEINTFPDKEIFIKIQESVDQCDVFVFQSIVFQPNDYLMELLLIIDALKRASAASITVVLPYYGYARQDRLDASGVPISAKLVANLLTRAGMNNLITLDLHSEQIEGFFDIPIEHLISRSILISYCSELHLEDAVVVAPDKGGLKLASAYAKQLGVMIALLDKDRIDSFHVAMYSFIGDVKGKTVLLPDDMCATAATIVQAAQICAQLGAKRIIALIGHGLFIGNALEKIDNSPIELVLTTNSISLNEKVRQHPKIRVISVASLFAKVIRKKCQDFFSH